MIKELHDHLLASGKTLALAESVTGGAASAALTRLAGASNYLNGGVVAYSNAAKVEVLGVDPKVIEREGAVSEEVARQMAEGARRVFDTDFSLAITGVAGPTGGSLQKPIGMAWCALAVKGGATESWKAQSTKGDRALIIDDLAEQLLSRLLKLLAA